MSWLRELVDWDDDAEALASALTLRGVAVETVERPGVGVRGIVAARIRAVEPHPGADRLTVCRVQAGGLRGTVVCGAPDAETGALVAWAAPGAVLPGGQEICARDFRGIRSEGMLCAPDELGLPGGHDGLLHLDAEIAEGADLVAGLGLQDPVLVLELTPNYAAHCQSILGVAREVAAITGAAIRRPAAYPPEDARVPTAAAAHVSIDAPELCPRYVARVLDRVRHRPSSLRIARRLAQCGMRPLGGVVDVTNYVMLELGQPLHAFDLARLEGAGVRVRRAAPGERIRTLDGKQRQLTADDLLIADGAGPVAIAGVMGGERTEVTPGTTAVLLESATFAADAVARTARRLGLSSEASARFGRGVDPGMARQAADRAASLLAEVASARVYAGVVDAGPGVRERAVTLRGRGLRALLGVRLSTAACGRHLERFGFRVQADGADRLRVVVPGWRPDVSDEVDLVEEVARSYGYDRIPAVLPSGDPGRPAPDRTRPAAAAARQVCLAAGCSEAQPYSFHGERLWERLRLPAGHPWRRATRVDNPMHAEQTWLRTALAGGLLETLAANARQRRADAAVFEVGRVFVAARPAARPDEPLHLGVAGYGALRPGDHAHAAEPFDFLGAKGICEEALQRAGGRASACRWTRPRPDAYPFLHPGRTAELRVGDLLIGWLGELHPAVRAEFDLPEPAAIGELDLTALATVTGEAFTLKPLPRFPWVRRDIAVVAPADLPAAGLEATIRATGGDLLTDVRLFDVYTGQGVPEGCRSLAYALTFQGDHTLTEAEADERLAAVRHALSVLPGVRLRS